MPEDIRSDDVEHCRRRGRRAPQAEKLTLLLPSVCLIVQPKASALKQLIAREVPGSVVTMDVGRSSSFEITMDGKLIYSKLEKGSFPDSKVTEHSDKQEAKDNAAASSTHSRLCIVVCVQAIVAEIKKAAGLA